MELSKGEAQMAIHQCRPLAYDNRCVLHTVGTFFFFLVPLGAISRFPRTPDTDHPKILRKRKNDGKNT